MTLTFAQQLLSVFKPTRKERQAKWVQAPYISVYISTEPFLSMGSAKNEWKYNIGKYTWLENMVVTQLLVDSR